jgi:DNA helicase-2/ATP-dependent DNA helicase PcrA
MRLPEETGLDVAAATKKRLQAFALLMDQLAQLSEETDAYTLAEQTLRVSGVMTALALDTTPEGIDRAQNVQELLNAIREFVAQRQEEGIDFTPITDFLSEVSLQTDQDENLSDTTERVTLMTVHAAKGLEFPVVFIGGMEENLFPSQFCVKPSEIEEERRLLYVAITRAMERCYLSYARQRFRNGQMAFNSPSRFLNDIDRQYMEVEKQRSVPFRSTPPPAGSVPGFLRTPSQKNAPEREYSLPERGERKVVSAAVCQQSGLFASGDRVSHRVFGDGTVVRVYRDEVTENDKIEINFDKQGTKTLLLTHAKLEKI